MIEKQEAHTLNSGWFGFLKRKEAAGVTPNVATAKAANASEKLLTDPTRRLYTAMMQRYEIIDAISKLEHTLPVPSALDSPGKTIKFSDAISDALAANDSARLQELLPHLYRNSTALFQQLYFKHRSLLKAWKKQAAAEIEVDMKTIDTIRKNDLSAESKEATEAKTKCLLSRYGCKDVQELYGLAIIYDNSVSNARDSAEEFVLKTLNNFLATQIKCVATVDPSAQQHLITLVDEARQQITDRVASDLLKRPFKSQSIPSSNQGRPYEAYTPRIPNFFTDNNAVQIKAYRQRNDQIRLEELGKPLSPNDEKMLDKIGRKKWCPMWLA